MSQWKPRIIPVLPSLEDILSYVKTDDHISSSATWIKMQRTFLKRQLQFQQALFTGRLSISEMKIFVCTARSGSQNHYYFWLSLQQSWR